MPAARQASRWLSSTFALILRSLGHEAKVVCDGLETTRAVMASEFDLFLMVVGMPSMDGLAATRRIREFERDGFRRPYAIHCATSHGAPEDFERSGQAGADGHLTKPIDLAKLVRVIGACRRAPDGLWQPSPGRSYAAGSARPRATDFQQAV
ncbi:response regulator [Phenylobacterium montanum]|nr:response regulator [Caulobacter sp. S6]